MVLPMPRVRAMFWITTLLALVLVRPLHWGVHALGGHAACSDTVASVDQAHEGCTHDHGTDGASTSEHSSERAPVDGDDLADCELCLAKLSTTPNSQCECTCNLCNDEKKFGGT